MLFSYPQLPLHCNPLSYILYILVIKQSYMYEIQEESRAWDMQNAIDWRGRDQEREDRYREND